MPMSRRNNLALAAALLAGGLLFASSAYAQGSGAGTPNGAQSADNSPANSDQQQAIMPKHKVAASHRHRHLASTKRKREFAAREMKRGHFSNAREDRMTAQLNKHQLREERATVMPASYGATTDDNKDQSNVSLQGQKPEPEPGTAALPGGVIPATTGDGSKGSAAN
jgi:hypothetical protein